MEPRALRGQTSEVSVRVLGVDPGSHKAGWGVIDVDGAHVTHVDNGVIFLDDSRDLAVRLVDLCHRLRDRVTTFQPDIAVVEDVFVNKGARSALILGQARGAVLATLGLAGVPVRSIPTSVVKLRVAGRGRAEKMQVAEMVSALLGLKEVPFEDAADALAVALSFTDARSPPLDARTPPRKKRGGARDGLAALARAQGKL